MELKITTVAGAQTHKSSVTVPTPAGGPVPHHIMANAVIHAVSAQLNMLQPTSDEHPLESIAVSIVRANGKNG